MVEKTTKWKTVEKNNPVAPPTPITADAGLREMPEMSRTEIASAPEIEEYQPLDANGNVKEDGMKRILVLIEPNEDSQSSRIMPIRWYNMSKVEVSIAAAEIARIMAMEMAVDAVSRAQEIKDEVDRQVLAILRQRIAEKSEAE